jgi:hypothetical protein
MGMTDLEEFRALLARWKVDFTEGTDDRFCDGPALDVENTGSGPDNPGYSGFTSTWYFDAAGTFVATGAWE